MSQEVMAVRVGLMPKKCGSLPVSLWGLHDYETSVSNAEDLLTTQAGGGVLSKMDVSHAYLQDDWIKSFKSI